MGSNPNGITHRFVGGPLHLTLDGFNYKSNFIIVQENKEQRLIACLLATSSVFSIRKTSMRISFPIL
jgi:hypothetical protein